MFTILARKRNVGEGKQGSRGGDGLAASFCESRAGAGAELIEEHCNGMARDAR
jgi:hypothetical protein